MASENPKPAEGSPRKPEAVKHVRKDSAMQRLRRRVTAKRDPAAVIVFEKRLLVAATAALVLAFVLWVVAVSTDFWFYVTAPEKSIFMNSTNSYFVSSHSGLWAICKYMVQNGSTNTDPIKKCHYHRLFPSAEFIQKNTEVDRTILDYTRTETAFAIISFCLMVMGFGFSVYTFKESRYMFKRLAGGVHFISAAAVLVVIEVVVNSVKYEEQFLNDRHPKGATWSYGYSFAVAWLAFILLIICGATFMICSRKKKGDRGGGAQSGDDEPHILGRM